MYYKPVLWFITHSLYSVTYHKIIEINAILCIALSYRTVVKINIFRLCGVIFCKTDVYIPRLLRN